MQVAQPVKYDNIKTIETRKITNVPTIKRHTMIMTDKDKIKVIKYIERLVRSSQEYRDYIAYLKKEIDMTQCSFFVGINNKDSRRVSIEIHHEPFTLFDITQIVLDSWLSKGLDINPILIAHEIVKLHYMDKVGLIPVSVTVHQLVHSGKLFIPLQNVKGKFVEFMEEYDEYISEDISDRLQVKINMSTQVESEEQDMSILERKFTYLEIDGMKFPELVEEDIRK